MNIDWRSVKGDATLVLPTDIDFTSVDIIGTGADGATTAIFVDPSGSVDGIPGTGMRSRSNQYLSCSDVFYF